MAIPSSLREVLIAFIRDWNDNPALEIKNDANLIQTGLLDSGAVMDLIIFLEDEHDIEIDLLEHKPEKLLTVDGLVAAAEQED